MYTPHSCQRQKVIKPVTQSNESDKKISTNKTQKSPNTSQVRRIIKPKVKPIVSNANKLPSERKSQSEKPNQKSHDTYIDLTKNPNKVMNKSTLLVGSSIRKGVRTSELQPNATVRTFSGAKIEDVKTKLEEYDIDHCKTIILHVGGNDADNGTDPE